MFRYEFELIQPFTGGNATFTNGKSTTDEPTMGMNCRMYDRFLPSALFMLRTAWAVVPEPAKESRIRAVSFPAIFKTNSIRRWGLGVSEEFVEAGYRRYTIILMSKILCQQGVAGPEWKPQS